MSDHHPSTRTDAQADGPAVADPSLVRRSATAGLLGTIIEYYDVSLYGLLAVIVAPAFFPSDNAAASTVAALAVFGTAYLVRPLGGVFFGWIGDRYSRRAALLATILGMCLFSTVIGLLPTHADISLLAPILLVVARLGQGFAAGGEVMGATTYVLESVPPTRRGRYTAFVPMGSSLGFALAAFVVGGTSAFMSADQLADWGWRIPFLLSLPLGLVCLFVRLRLEDSPEFTALARSRHTTRAPLLDAVRTAPAAIARVAAYTVALSSVGHVVFVYIAVLLIQHLGFDRQTVFWMSAVVLALGALTAPIFGALSDRVGRRTVMVGAAASTIVLFVPLFLLLANITNPILAGVVFLCLAVIAQSYSPGYTAFVESFPTTVRYTGSALGYNIGIVIAGFAPAISAQLVESTGSALAPAWWVTGAALMGLLTALTVRIPSADDSVPERV